jgi:hypothetical protein
MTVVFAEPCLSIFGFVLSSCVSTVLQKSFISSAGEEAGAKF